MTIPGRMALLVTLFLVLVNIFNSVTGNAPKAEGLTAVETWVTFILHVNQQQKYHPGLLKLKYENRSYESNHILKTFED